MEQKFEEDLKSHQEHVDKIKSLAEEILSSCHPNAVRFVKYYLTITQTRWDQVKNDEKHFFIPFFKNSHHTEIVNHNCTRLVLFTLQFTLQLIIFVFTFIRFT